MGRFSWILLLNLPQFPESIHIFEEQLMEYNCIPFPTALSGIKRSLDRWPEIMDAMVPSVTVLPGTHQRVLR